MRFFLLKNPKLPGDSRVTDFVQADGSKMGQAPRCAKCGNFIGMIPLMPPVRVEIDMWGDRFGDFAFGPGDELLVARPILEKLKAASMIGLEIVGEAEIVKISTHQKTGEIPPCYYCCRPVRSSAIVDDVKSGFVWQHAWTCDLCRLGRNLIRGRRIALISGSWSGEDIFFPRGLSGRVLVSEKFKDVVEHAEASNCVLVPAEEFSFDFQPWK